MKCKCIKDMQEKLKNELSQQQEYRDLVINYVSCDIVSFVSSGNKLVSGMHVPFTVYHEMVKRKKETTVNIIANYCPLCGLSLKDMEN